MAAHPVFGSACQASAARVVRAPTLRDAAHLAHTGARCVYVRAAFARIRRAHLPPDFDQRDIRVCSDGRGGSAVCDKELREVVTALARAHCEATGARVARARVARVSGTPCPRAHVDKLGLRALVALQGPGVVLLGGPSADDVALRAGAGDVVFMAGVSDDEEDYGEPVWHRSPRRAEWMPDRIVVQVDNW